MYNVLGGRGSTQPENTSTKNKLKLHMQFQGINRNKISLFKLIEGAHFTDCGFQWGSVK